jgi:hypothetical protein
MSGPPSGSSLRISWIAQHGRATARRGPPARSIVNAMRVAERSVWVGVEMSNPWRLDVDGILAAHQTVDGRWCRVCEEECPCGPVWAARRVMVFRARRGKTPASPGAGSDAQEGATGVSSTKKIDVDMADAQWFKSSYSSGNTDNCVEVAFVDGVVAVRDSKNRDRGVQVYTAPEWQAFLAGVKDGEFEG